MTQDKTPANDLFEPEAPDQSGLFSDTSTIDPDKDYSAELVGEDKKYKDVNALAKKAIHADQHILKIESENAQLRQELKTRLSLEEFYDQVKNTPSQSTPSEQQQDEPERTEVSIEQIDSLVAKRLQERLMSEQQKSNLAYVQSELEKRLGPNFRKLMQDRAREVGEAPENLTQLAMTKPKLFMELMAPNAAQSTNVPGLPRTQMDSGKMGFSQNTTRDSNYYAKLRQTDKKKYESREVQMQMHKDALALGEKFFQ